VFFFFKGALFHCVLLYVSLWMGGFAVHTLNCVLFMLKCWTFHPVLLLSSRRY
jgi:hypothetical protein